MAMLIRQTMVWSGVAGLPGYTQFYHSVSDPISTSAQAGNDSVTDFFSNQSSLLPEDITFTMDPVYQVIDEATGEIDSEGTVGVSNAPFQGTYVGGWSAQVGVLVEWLTGTYIRGRRLRGRTYVVPLGGVGDADGTLTSATLDVVRGGSAAITGSSEDFRVWHRPVAGAGGSSSGISSAVVRDHAAVLRSRMQ